MAKRNAQILNSFSLLTDHDIYLFKEGNHFRLYEKLGAHMAEDDGVKGTFFAVWAPNARSVSVIGDFNGWNPQTHPLTVRPDDSGIWEAFLPGIGKGALYKYHIVSRIKNYTVDKGDPFGFYWELPPNTASVVWDLNYKWKDSRWMRTRQKKNSLDAPISIYEVHLGSWRRNSYRVGRICERDGLYTRRVPAGHGAPILWLLGLSDRRIFCPLSPLWKLSGFYVFDRLPSPQRYRRDTGLGAIAFSFR